MLGERSEQRGLWEADRLYIDHVGRGSFYGLLASMRGQLFEDEEFAELYCADNGRDSVPPSLLSTALHTEARGVFDVNATRRPETPQTSSTLAGSHLPVRNCRIVSRIVELFLIRIFIATSF